MRKRSHFLITLPLVIVSGAALLFLFLPYLFDLYLFPRLIAELPFTAKEVSLSRLSPWQIRGTITMADQDRPTLLVPRFEISYTPGSLLKKEIAVLLLDSASLHVEMRDGQPILRGLPSQDTSLPGQENTPSFTLPLAVKTIILQNCSITIHRDSLPPIHTIVDGRFTLGYLEQPARRKLLSDLSGQILTKGDLSLKGELEVQAEHDRYIADLHLQAPDTGQVLSLAPGLKELPISGELSLQGQAILNRSSTQLTGYNATVTSADLQIRTSNFAVGKNAAEFPLAVRIDGDMKKIQYRATNIHLVKPEKATLDLAGEIDLSDETFSGSGHLLLKRTNSAVTIEVDGNRQQTETTLHCRLAGDAFSLAKMYSVSSFTADGKITFDGAKVTATVNSLIPAVTLKKNKIKLTNLSLQLPFQYPPPPAPGQAGTIKIGRIDYQNINSGKLEATVRQSANGIAFTTLVTTPFVPGLRLRCDGAASAATDIALLCRLPKTRVNSSTLPRFIGLPEELAFNGKLSGSGEFRMMPRGPEGKLRVAVDDASLTHGEIRLSNINTGLAFPRLPLLQSSPGQLCTIGVLEFGNIKLTDARIHFRIDDEQTVFFEKLRASWCGGKVETGSFSLAGNMKELETTIYCDRLGFTELLAQFGIDQTEGQGSLNGRLPMLLSRQGVVIDDGFLFSTPGNSGIVRFHDTGQLRQGIPDIKQNAYLDYSMKALKNFEYNWTKLSFNSQDDELVISMELDGKPLEPLPFGYRNGQIVANGQGPGLQHPIRLDVNFRLPIQDLLQYGKSIQSMMEKM